MRAFRVVISLVLALSLCACDLPTFPPSEPFGWSSPEAVSTQPAEPAPVVLPEAAVPGPAPLHLGTTAPGPDMKTSHKVVTEVKKHGRVRKVVTWVEDKVKGIKVAPADKAPAVRVEIHKPDAQLRGATPIAKLQAPAAADRYSCATVRFWAALRTEAQLRAMAVAAGVTVTPSQEREARKCLTPSGALPNISPSMVASSCHGRSPCASAASAPKPTRITEQTPSRRV